MAVAAGAALAAAVCQLAELPGVVTQLDFWSASDGIAATYQPGTSSPRLLGNATWHTADGGRTWTRA